MLNFVIITSYILYQAIHFEEQTSFISRGHVLSVCIMYVSTLYYVHAVMGSAHRNCDEPHVFLHTLAIGYHALRIICITGVTGRAR